MCSGKIYYDFVAHRETVQRDDVAVIRIEQLYPLRVESLERILKRYDGAELVWAQEEPENMGAWRYIEDQLREKMDLSFPYVGREANASPAVASAKMHKQEQERILINALGLPGGTSGEASSDAAPAKAAPTPVETT